MCNMVGMIIGLLCIRSVLILYISRHAYQSSCMIVINRGIYINIYTSKHLDTYICKRSVQIFRAQEEMYAFLSVFKVVVAVAWLVWIDHRCYISSTYISGFLFSTATFNELYRYMYIAKLIVLLLQNYSIINHNFLTMYKWG